MPDTQCPQKQCQGTTPQQLHAGYVAHRKRNEEPCEASNTGHNQYMKLRRIKAARRQEQAEAAAEVEV